MSAFAQSLAAAPWLGPALGGVAGLMGGSFLNVVIGRLPPIALDDNRAREWPGALVHPGSHCPACRSPIRWRHNLPLIGYALLNGHCPDCGVKIPLRYPLVEAAGGLIGAGAVVALGFTPAALAVALLGLALLALAAIDLEHRILPDQIVLPMIWIGLCANATGLLAQPKSAIAGAMAGFAALTAIRIAYRRLRGIEGMGRGDPKLAAMIGAWLGLEAVMTTLLLAFAGGSLIAVAGLALKRLDPATQVPFGPALAAGAVAAAFGVSFY